MKEKTQREVLRATTNKVISSPAAATVTATATVAARAGAPAPQKNPKSLWGDLLRYQRHCKRLGFTKNELGFTGHGFRHSFAHQELEANGFIAAIKGRSIAVIGTIDKATGQAVALKDKDRLLVARALTSRQLGHSRVSITGAYYGSHRIAAVAAAVTNSVSRVDHAEKV